jgi:hypothetical protein
MRNNLVALFGAVLVFGSIPACDSAIDEAVPEPGTGTVVQNWTIEGSSELRKCAQVGAAQMRIVLFDTDETLYATQLAPCEAFTLTRVVRAQPYRAIAGFFDAAGNSVSETKDLGSFEVHANTTTTIAVDFAGAALTRP